MSEFSVQGQEDPTVSGSKFNAVAFIARQLSGEEATATVVRVISCSNSGAAAPAGTVTVQPLVNQIDGAGNATPHGQIYNVPYGRLQAGGNAIILDPQPGDIGLVVFCLSDISSVKATQAQANPGSRRRFDWADAIYVVSILGTQAPTQFFEFSATGITVTTPTNLRINGESNITGSLNVTGNVTVGNGASGSFTTPSGQTVTVQDGIVTNIF